MDFGVLQGACFERGFWGRRLLMASEKMMSRPFGRIFSGFAARFVWRALDFGRRGARRKLVRAIVLRAAHNVGSRPGCSRVHRRARKLLRNSPIRRRVRGCCAFVWWPLSFALASPSQNPLGPGGAPTPLDRAGVLKRAGQAHSSYHTLAQHSSRKLGPDTLA